MADQSANTTLIFSTAAEGERFAVFQVESVTTNDTAGVGTWFRKVKSVANLFAGGVTGNTVPTFTATTITFAQAGLAGDTVFLSVIGDSV